VRLALRFWIAFVLAAVTSSATVAWALPCCAHGCEPASASPDCSDEEGERHHDSAPCSCPLDGRACCAGVPASTGLPDPSIAPSFLPDFIDLSFLPVAPMPTDAPPHDVLHVPKHVAA